MCNEGLGVEEESHLLAQYPTPGYRYRNLYSRYGTISYRRVRTWSSSVYVLYWAIWYGTSTVPEAAIPLGETQGTVPSPGDGNRGYGSCVSEYGTVPVPVPVA